MEKFFKNMCVHTNLFFRCISDKELKSFDLQKNDVKFFGCSKDVFAELNKICKLKSSCEMKVTDLENENEDFCNPGLNKHLEVNYSCLKSKILHSVLNVK